MLNRNNNINTEHNFVDIDIGIGLNIFNNNNSTASNSYNVGDNNDSNMFNNNNSNIGSIHISNDNANDDSNYVNGTTNIILNNNQTSAAEHDNMCVPKFTYNVDTSPTITTFNFTPRVHNSYLMAPPILHQFYNVPSLTNTEIATTTTSVAMPMASALFPNNDNDNNDDDGFSASAIYGHKFEQQLFNEKMQKLNEQFDKIASEAAYVEQQLRRNIVLLRNLPLIQHETVASLILFLNKAIDDYEISQSIILMQRETYGTKVTAILTSQKKLRIKSIITIEFDSTVMKSRLLSKRHNILNYIKLHIKLCYDEATLMMMGDGGCDGGLNFMLYFTQCTKSISFMDYLTPYYLRLYNKARILKSHANYKFVDIENGLIYVRKNIGIERIIIRSFTQLARIFTENNLPFYYKY